MPDVYNVSLTSGFPYLQISYFNLTLHYKSCRKLNEFLIILLSYWLFFLPGDYGPKSRRRGRTSFIVEVADLGVLGKE